MKRRSSVALLLVLLLLTFRAYGDPRDAEAVLNRCGKPLKGDTTILESTVTGGRRILAYERGEVHFDRVANVGWTFAYGTHGKRDHLTADEMAKYMPCVKDALAAAASPEPLVKITPVQRVEVSMKRSFKMLILYTIGFLAVLGVIFYVWSKRTREEEMMDEYES